MKVKTINEEDIEDVIRKIFTDPSELSNIKIAPKLKFVSFEVESIDDFQIELLYRIFCEDMNIRIKSTPNSGTMRIIIQEKFFVEEGRIMVPKPEW